MFVEKEKIQLAKEALGDANAELISTILNVKKWNPCTKRGCCPFHPENTPSFVYNPKTFGFKCFGCGRTVDIIDAYVSKGHTFLSALEALFKQASVDFCVEKGTRTRPESYIYPKPPPEGSDKSRVYDYWAKRKISKETIDYADVRQCPKEGHTMFLYYDCNDVLTSIKYRPSRKLNPGDTKTWFQKNVSNHAILFNMNRINTGRPLLIVEGEGDALAAIEAGYTNVVSVPLGATSFKFIENCWDWLMSFSLILVAADNDTAGTKLKNECIRRLGSWRTRAVEIPTEFTNEQGKTVPVKDLCEVLYYFGKEKLLAIIHNTIEVGIKDLCEKLTHHLGGCVDADTEYFNGEKWVRIADYKRGDRVLQYNADGTAELVLPSKYHKYPCDYLYRLKSTYGIDQAVSSDHNLVYITSKGNLATKPMREVLDAHYSSDNGFYGRFITSFMFDGGNGLPLTDDELRLSCAVICEAHFDKHRKRLSRCRINLKKQRKKDRLETLLCQTYTPYKKVNYNPKDLGFHSYFFYSPVFAKSFGKMWFLCSQHQLQVICDEVLRWDGCVRKNRHAFSTSKKETADFIQFAFSACGFRATINYKFRVREGRKSSHEYTVVITKSNLPALVNSHNKIEIPLVKTKDGFKYCFTVPSGMLVLRRNGRINITGTSGLEKV